LGTIMGTVAYMAPEQARGQSVDKRADIWAFGVVLLEMLTARRPFTGATASDTLAAVLTREPDWSTLPAATPAGVRRLLARCLEKDVRKRLRDVGAARFDLDDRNDAVAAAPSRPSRAPAWQRAVPWTVAAMALVVAAWAMLVRPESHAAADRVTYV